MQIFQELQKKMYSIGFSPQLKPHNNKIVSVLVIIFVTVILLLIFPIYEANNAREYMESIYICNVCIGMLVSLTNTVLKSKKLFEFIKSMDEFVNDSKWNFDHF